MGALDFFTIYRHIPKVISACGKGGQWERALELLEPGYVRVIGLWGKKKEEQRTKKGEVFKNNVSQGIKDKAH